MLAVFPPRRRKCPTAKETRARHAASRGPRRSRILLERTSLDVGVLPSAPEPETPTFPDWWRWELTFSSHAELRMEQRGVTELEVRAMLEGATEFEPSVVEGRFMIHPRHAQRPWIVIVEPDAGVNLLVVVTVYEVSE